ncbi:MAG TPA: hypothetical protein VNK95_00775 [Caldilineaceae bacterium]|nr:hypothetical protein [Caldilineaceae bacterium]
MWLATALVFALGVYFLAVWPWISRWGATDEEVQQALPGDELVPAPAFVATKAVTIHAPAEVVWSWLVQLGVDRGGMYSYLWVENWLLRLGVANSDTIRPEWQTLQVGDFIRFTPPDYALNPGPGLHVTAIEPQRALVGCFGLENRPPDCAQGGAWQFVLVPVDEGATRLLLRGRNPGGSALAAAGGKVAHAFQFYMERKMLLGIKERAEGVGGYLGRTLEEMHFEETGR